MAFLSYGEDGIPFLGLLLWLQLLGLLLSGASAGAATRPRSPGGRGWPSGIGLKGNTARLERMEPDLVLKVGGRGHPSALCDGWIHLGTCVSWSWGWGTMASLLVPSFPNHPACGHRTMRIYGGKKAPQRKWPWQVSLQSYNRHICGGSLITNRLVLTAAHCVLRVILGNNKLNEFDENAVMVPVKDVYPHQGFEIKNLTNDIAIALLAFPVNYSPYIQPICLPERPFTVNAETLCWVTGWGRMERNVILRETEQKILSQKICRKRYEDYFGVPKYIVREGMICGYHDGDSGGPLACEVNNTWIQIGVVSWGYMCGRDLLPAVYTEVIYFKKWLNLTVNQASHIYHMGVYMLLICLLLPEAILVTM
uniref:Peptidase S1 domain-containing protein n=1 Tax=Marmota marmota marmota TaxID=9994 RepID=A0A8C6EQN3_MARMA